MTATQNFLVDSFVAGLGLKAPCVAVAETNITLAGEQTVNGVAVVAKDRVLVTAQAFAVNNGIYVVSTGEWQRAGDFDGNRDVVTGTQVSVVKAGGSDDYYELTSPNPITIGVSDINFSIANRGFSLLYERTALEIANGITPTDLSYPPGNVFRYGAVADSALGVQGTDCYTAFQNAIDSGHAVYVPEGYFSIESRLVILSEGSTQGGKTFVMTSNSRLERFSAVNNDPIIQVVGHQNYVNGSGGVLAARNVGGFTEGVLLIGVDPTVTDNNDPTTGDMNLNFVNNFKVIGKVSNTGWDGSVGIYVNAASRKRGLWKTGGNSCNVYYNNFDGNSAQQFDYNFHVSSEASFNSFDECKSLKYGHAGVSCLGYGNSWASYISEQGNPQDTTERYNIYCGIKNDPFTPETGTDGDPSATFAITGISAAAAAVVTAVGHGLSTEDYVLIRDVVDNGPDGDLEDAVNNGHFQVTYLTDDTFSIPLDTSGLTNTYSSGGTMQTDFLPNTGSRTNSFQGSVEIAYDASTLNIRLFGWRAPVASYDVGDILGTYGENVLDIQGALVGGIGIGGSTDATGIGPNIIRTHAARVNRAVPENIHDYQYARLDDGSGSILFKESVAHLSSRKEDMTDDFTYDLFSQDNVGITSASLRIELTYGGKDGTNQDHATRKIVWLCPVTASTAREPKVVYRDGEDYGGENPFIPKISYGAGTAANTGKFTVSIGTNNVAGTMDAFCSWDAKIVASNLYDRTTSNLDWEGDLSYLSTSSAGAVTDTEWKSLTKYKTADKSIDTNNTIEDDNHLAGWNPKADAYYRVTGHLRYNQNIGDFKYLFQFSQTPQEFSVATFGQQAGATASNGIDAYHNVDTTEVAHTSFTDGLEVGLAVSGFFRTNATTGGTVDFQWAQNTSNANATILREGSWLNFERID